MNLFDIWARNRARLVSELVASTFLNYLLNPKEDHGLGSWFAVEFLKLNNLTRLPLGPNTVISVFPEQDLGPGRGRIDALLSIRFGDEIHLVGIEVKIHDGSSKNVSSMGQHQLARYYEVLEATLLESESVTGTMKGAVDKIVHEVTEGENVKISDVSLAYVVPRMCSSWPTAITESYTELRNAHETEFAQKFIQRLRIVPWVSIDEGENSLYRKLFSEHGVRKPTCEISALLGHFLNESANGLAAQPDSHCLHFMRCLRHAAVRDFLAPSPVGGKHATQTTFINSLEDSGEIDVFTALSRAVRPERMLSANPRNTTIGIRYADNRGGSLFRIRTVTDYGENFNILDEIQLEFPKDSWTESDLTEAFNRARFDDALLHIGDFKRGYHADAQRDKPVIIVSIKKAMQQQAWSEEETNAAVRTFERLHRSLTEMVSYGPNDAE